MKLQSLQQLPAIKGFDVTPPKPKLSEKEFFKGIANGLKPIGSSREKIAGGDILWKPVNKQAAMLLAKSPEINKAPLQMSTTRPTQPVIRENAAKIKSQFESDAALDRLIEKKEKDIPPQLMAKAEELRSIRASLDLATDMFRSDMINFTEELPKHLQTIRTWRMTVEREKEISLKAMRELRQFFLESDHEKEMMRLNDFVRTCERLAILAKDGTLDKVAEVMLKLAQ